MDKKIPVTIGISQRDLDFIDACASELLLSRSEFISNVLLTGFDDARLMKKVGFFKVIGQVRNLMENSQKQMELPMAG